jgi:hypothetical protein
MQDHQGQAVRRLRLEDDLDQLFDEATISARLEEVAARLSARKIPCPRTAPATLVSVEGSGGMIYAFGVGLANFAAGRSRLPRQIAADVAEVLPLIAWYGATGNLALAAGEPVDVAQRLAEITGTAWAVIPGRDLAAALGALEAQPVPRVQAGIRPTPGLAFAVEPARSGLIRSIPEAALQRLNDRIVLVHKFDLLDGNRLDRARRRAAGARCQPLSPGRLAVGGQPGAVGHSRPCKSGPNIGQTVVGVRTRRSLRP